MHIEYSHPSRDDADEIVALWNASFGPNWPLAKRLLLQSIDGDPYYENEGAWLARDGSTLVGYVLSKSMKSAGPEWGRFEKRGGIGALCVHPDYRRRGIGSTLLQKAEQFLEAHGSPRTLLYYPHHLLPGVPMELVESRAFFENHGFTGGSDCYDLKRDLAEYTVPEKVLIALKANPEVEIRPAREDEKDAVIEMVAREFPGGWTYSTRFVFGHGKASEVIIAVEKGEVFGFCLTADFNSNYLLPSTYWFPLLGEKFGGLGPIGLAKEHRKRGLGLALCALAVQDLKERGVQTMVIDWTNLVSFYEKLGFVVWKQYWQGARN